jgi:Family of unknown function (DUF6454)
MPAETGAILEGRPSMTMLRGAALGLMLLAAGSAGSAALGDDGIGERVQKLTRATPWKQVDTIPIGFRTFHPQGMVKIGEVFYVSSVDIQVPTKRFAEPQGGYDRDTGAGVGHLFKVDAKGNLLGDLTLGEGSIYHPGGIDYDGKHIWVPVSEYRPNSRAIIYRVDPQTMTAVEVLRFADHVGGIVHNTDDKSLHGVSWGSRRFYKWTLDAAGKVTNAATPPEQLRVTNRALYIDYQDCHYIGGRRMLCSGLNNYKPSPDGPIFRLGGFELVDLTTDLAVYQVPIELWAPSGLPMTYNPFWVEVTGTGLRAYFMPDDDKSTLFVYEAAVK